MFTPSRASALSVLSEFLPRIPGYASQRSFARPGHPDVSRLSPYIRRRLITEQEVVQAVLAAYPFSVAEKFIQEVVWRTYWKGWLELNPWVWDGCVTREVVLRGEELRSPWGDTYARAIHGQTALPFFNDWVAELRESGYLHNHVRMWFASTWIHTLRIPWQLGAMFMYRNLLDGDPASNTLSWRWVAGLQTKGKSYLAKPSNIEFHSEGRWTPGPGELAETTCHVDEDLKAEPQRAAARQWGGVPEDPYGVLTTSEDLSIEVMPQLFERAHAAALWRSQSCLGESELVVEFVRGAEEDSLHRVGSRGVGVGNVAEVIAWVRASKLTHVVLVAPPVGPLRQPIEEMESQLSEQGIGCSFYRCAWDARLHPLAARGFFPFWERVKGLIREGEALFYG
jgi:deoxyribodipyrimidine photo-lyase